MNKVYFTADLHFGDKNLNVYEQRPYSCVLDMDKLLIESWNNCVSANDTVFVLGDVSMYNKDKTIDLVKQLAGYKVLIMGNHDNNFLQNEWFEIGFNEVSQYPILYDKYFILSHHPIYLSKNMPYGNIHGHLHHLSYKSKQYFNTGVDLNSYCPVPFDNIKECMDILY